MGVIRRSFAVHVVVKLVKSNVLKIEKYNSFALNSNLTATGTRNEKIY